MGYVWREGDGATKEGYYTSGYNYEGLRTYVTYVYELVIE